jgi:membrane protein YqaA with SNARE-associated domain
VALLTPQPSGPGDTDAIDGAGVVSSLGAGLAMVGALLAVGTVGAGWLRARWLAQPVVLLVAALVRFHAVPR